MEARESQPKINFAPDDYRENLNLIQSLNLIKESFFQQNFLHQLSIK